MFFLRRLKSGYGVQFFFENFLEIFSILPPRQNNFFIFILLCLCLVSNNFSTFNFSVFGRSFFFGGEFFFEGPIKIDAGVWFAGWMGGGLNGRVLGVFFFLLWRTFPFEGFSMAIDFTVMWLLCYTWRRIYYTFKANDYTLLFVVKLLIVKGLIDLIFSLV